MDTAQFTCRGPALTAEDHKRGGLGERLGCGESLDAVIAAAERAVQDGTQAPGLCTLTCPCALQRPITVWIEPKD